MEGFAIIFKSPSKKKRSDLFGDPRSQLTATLRVRRDPAARKAQFLPMQLGLVVAMRGFCKELRDGA